MSNPRSDRIRSVETQTCPRRIGEFGPWKREDGLDSWVTGRWAATQEEADAVVAEFMTAHPNGSIGNVHWNYGGDQPRTCSFCGGVHPDDAVELIKRGWEVNRTDKRYKCYLEPAGLRAYYERLRASGYNREQSGPIVHSPIPPVKLYLQHCTEAQIDALNATIAEANP